MVGDRGDLYYQSDCLRNGRKEVSMAIKWFTELLLFFLPEDSCKLNDVNLARRPACNPSYRNQMFPQRLCFG